MEGTWLLKAREVQFTAAVGRVAFVQEKEGTKVQLSCFLWLKAMMKLKQEAEIQFVPPLLTRFFFPLFFISDSAEGQHLVSDPNSLPTAAS